MSAPANAPSAPADDEVHVTIGSVFMEDYHAGRPWSHNQAFHEVYVSKDGTAQLLTVTQNPPAVAHVFPDPESFTGWSATATFVAARRARLR